VKKTNISGPTFSEHSKEDAEMHDSNFNYSGLEVFSHRLNLGSAHDGSDYLFKVRVKVDQRWRKQPVRVWPPVLIQSHVANARTNTD